MSKGFYEAEVIEGLEELAFKEIKAAGGKPVFLSGPGVLHFKFGKSLSRLQGLRIANSVYQVHSFDVPRPKALLGQQNFDLLIKKLNDHIDLMGRNNIHKFRLEAAGKDSPVFKRLITQLEQRLKIPADELEGDLFIRIK